MSFAFFLSISSSFSNSVTSICCRFRPGSRFRSGRFADLEEGPAALVAPSSSCGTAPLFPISYLRERDIKAKRVRQRDYLMWKQIRANGDMAVRQGYLWLGTPETKIYNGRELDNCLWQLERSFEATKLKDQEAKKLPLCT